MNVNRFCQAACPYGAIYIDPEDHVAQKCTFCEHRTAQGLAPACVDAWPTRCRIFGDLDDPTSEIGRKARENPTTVWKPEAGTKPRVVYIDPARALCSISRTMGCRSTPARRCRGTLAQPRASTHLRRGYRDEPHDPPLS